MSRSLVLQLVDLFLVTLKFFDLLIQFILFFKAFLFVSHKFFCLARHACFLCLAFDRFVVNVWLARLLWSL